MKKLILFIFIALLLMSCEVTVYKSEPQNQATTPPSIEQIEMVPNSADSTIRVRVWVRGGKIDDLWDASVVEDCRVRCDSVPWVSLTIDPAMDEGPSIKAFRFSGVVRDSSWYPTLLYGYINPNLNFYARDIFGKADSFLCVVPMAGDTLKRYAGLGNKLM